MNNLLLKAEMLAEIAALEPTSIATAANSMFLLQGGVGGYSISSTITVMAVWTNDGHTHIFLYPA